MDSGYYMLLLPDMAQWQGFFLKRLSVTDEFLRHVRLHLPYVPFDPRNYVTPGSVFPELNLTEEDTSCLVILASMLVHDAMAASAEGIAVAADGITRIIRRPFFWVEGRTMRDGSQGEVTMGLLEAATIQAAQFESRLIAYRQGYD